MNLFAVPLSAPSDIEALTFKTDVNLKQKMRYHVGLLHQEWG